MSEILSLAASVRTEIGTGASRALRRNGMVPGIIYGTGNNPVSITVAEKDITKIYRRHGFRSTVIELDLEGKKQKVLPKAVELNPVNELVRHVDFVYLDDKTQKVEVPVAFEGKERSIGLKRGGFLNIICRRIKLLCPSDNIPRDIKIDITNMGIGSSIRGSSIQLPEGCAMVSKNDFIIASITGRGGKDDSAKEGQAEGAAATPAK